MKFEEALSKAQSWSELEGVYAVGESLDQKDNKVIIVFADKERQEYNDEIPQKFHGYTVLFYYTGEIVPLSNENR